MMEIKEVKGKNLLGKFLSSRFIQYALIAVLIIFSVFAVYYDEYTEVTSAELELEEYFDEINEGELYEQVFVCEYNGFESIGIYLANYFRTNTCTLYVQLYEGEQLLQSWEVDCAQILANGYRLFILDDPIKESAGRSFTIRFYSDAQSGNAITAYYNTSGGYTGLSVNGEEQEGQSLCYQVTYKNAYSESLGGMPYILRFFAVVAAIFVVWAFLQKKALLIEVIFLCLWIPLSILFSCAAPEFSVPDAYWHFLRAYEVSHGGWVSDYNEELRAGGNELPMDGVSISPLMNSWQTYDADKDSIVLSQNDVFVEFTNQCLMSPLNYLPQAIGIYIARHLTNKIWIIVFSGAFVNWLFVTVLFFFAIRYLPVGKEALCIIALMPMNLIEAVSLSSDSAVVALSALLIAFVLHLRYKQNTCMSRLQIVFMYVLAIFLSMYKIVYVVFCMLYFLIPGKRFKRGKMGKAIHAFVMIAIVAILSLSWAQIAGQFMLKEGTDSTLQTAYILKFPLRYYITLCRTLFADGMLLLQETFGTWVSKSTLAIVTMLCCFRLVSIVQRERMLQTKDEKGRAAERFCFLMVVVFVVVLMATSEYLYWTFLYWDEIQGFQGRYFMPLILPVYLIAVHTCCPKEGQSETLTLSSQFVLVTADVCLGLNLLFGYI